AQAIAQWVGAFSYLWIMWLQRVPLGLQTASPADLVPTLEDLGDFAGAGSAMLFRQLCNVGAWTFMSSAATRMGVVTIAAHQVILSMWLVIAFAQDAFGVSGQVLVARYLGMAADNSVKAAADATPSALTARIVAKRVLSLSFLMGVALATAGLVVTPLLLPVVCKSAEVQTLVLQEFPMILRAFPICCLVWTWDSLFYGASDFVYQAKTIAFGSAVGVAGVLASIRLNWGLRGIWTSMIFYYFGLRMIAHFRRFNSAAGPFG
ncbi:unnamed protein product, partial [Phaeothamnion confervicola]